eukprot:628939-Amphidinium_carterae.1
MVSSSYVMPRTCRQRATILSTSLGAYRTTTGTSSALSSPDHGQGGDSTRCLLSWRENELGQSASYIDSS